MPRGYSDVDQLPRERRGEVGICVIFIKECVLAGDGLDAADKKHKHSTIKARNYYLWVLSIVDRPATVGSYSGQAMRKSLNIVLMTVSNFSTCARHC
ncbi:hypothetical protein POPTR_002G132850v4 [Populus trichocarpa]|uniref:Uncharacterized protein n=1 Tax=Populus trichocarpa TaxID=3694 RepID=A0A3N7ENC4_POPTR|nr:hypothetical protein BDE02_02G122200 [Populus trichocarpa]RQO86922.1 hypothetical protein POPTR_002G132850v4 [Populus trichocarpa]